jgi:PAS domain S-box-containing protein
MKDFSYYHKHLNRIARDPIFSAESKKTSLRFLTKEIAKIIEADYVGYWSFDKNHSEITSVMIFDKPQNKWTSGDKLKQVDAPSYFNTISTEQVVDISDIRKHSAVKELLTTYLEPNNIESLLDVPVIYEGNMVGIICCEVREKPRDWTSEDKFFMLAASDYVSKIIETDYRKKLSNQLVQESLNLGEEQLKALLTALPIPLALLDRESRYLAISDSWVSQYAFSVPQPIGVKIWEAHQHFRTRWIERILSSQDGEKIENEEEMIQGPSGEDIWMSWQLVPWKNLQGQHAGIVIVCEDITFEKETEIKLRQTAKLTALGEMAGGIAHEINNPLSILKGFIDLMQKKLNLNQVDREDFVAYLQKSSATINRISRVVKAMKRVSRDSSRDPMEIYPLSIILEDGYEFMIEKFKSQKIKFEYAPYDENILINCRPVEISQVVLNLLSNSMHAVQENGWIKLSVDKKKNKAILRFSDSGPGIAKSIREKIFQPFFTTKDIGQGTGLGLSISRKIIENHGGTLYLNESAPFTEFIAEIPLV